MISPLDSGLVNNDEHNEDPTEEEKGSEELAEADKEDTVKNGGNLDEKKAKISKDEAEAVARRMKDEEVLTGRVNPKAYKR